jgi:hypothetical protein
VSGLFFNQLLTPTIENNLLAALGETSDLRGKVTPTLSPCLVTFFYKDKAYQNLWCQRKAECLDALIPKGWNASTTADFDLDLKKLAANPINKVVYALNFLATPAWEGVIRRTAEAQTLVEQSLLACALERYRIARGSYPESLNQLMPEYLAKLPNSPITGKPVNYSLKPEGSFLLWSPGWNLQSAGGKPGEFKGEGDIVWGQALPRASRPKTENNKDN